MLNFNIKLKKQKYPLKFNLTCLKRLSMDNCWSLDDVDEGIQYINTIPLM